MVVFIRLVVLTRNITTSVIFPGDLQPNLAVSPSLMWTEQMHVCQVKHAGRLTVHVLQLEHG